MTSNEIRFARRNAGALSSCLAIAAAAMAFAPAAAFAQPAGGEPATAGQAEPAAEPAPAIPPEESTSGISDITVTARRVEESAQRVPVTITAFSGNQLQAMQVNNLDSLQKFLPAVNLCCTAFNLADKLSVRGILNGAPTYFADVPIDPSGYSNFFDIEAVEVLKGPQGTLFGQASNTGAIVIRPKKPGEEFGGYISGTLGNYSRRTFEGAVDLPIAPDRVLFRLAGITQSRRGYVRDLKSGVWHGNDDYWVVRPSLTVKLTDRIENYTMYEHSYAKSNGFSQGLWVLQDFNFNNNEEANFFSNVFQNGGDAATYNALRKELLIRQMAAGPYARVGISTGCASPTGPIPGPFFVDDLDYPQVACPRDRVRDERLINVTTFEVTDDWTVKNVFGYVWHRENFAKNDIDGSPLLLLDFGSIRNPDIYEPQPQPGVTPIPGWSNELQVHGTAGIFDITAGLFLLDHSFDTGIIYSEFNAFPLPAQRLEGYKRSLGVYGQTNINLGGFVDGLTATLGLRYTKDKVGQTTTTFNDALQPIDVFGGDDSPFGRVTFNNVAYTAGLQYQLTRDTMFYVTTARGFNAGGLQDRRNFESFKPASLTNYEVGVKSTLDLGGVPVRFNGAYWRGNFSDVQVFDFGPYIDHLGQSASGNTTKNAAKAIVEGFEAETTIRPLRGLELSGNVTRLKNRYTKFPTTDFVGNPIDISNTSFLYSPKWKYGLRGSYTQGLPNALGRLVFTGNWTHRSKIIVRTVPIVPRDPTNRFTGFVCNVARTVANGYPVEVADGKIIDRDCRRGYGNLDLGVSWREVMGFDKIDLDFLWSNVTKNVISDSQAELPEWGAYSPQPAVPRMWTLRASYRF